MCAYFLLSNGILLYSARYAREMNLEPEMLVADDISRTKRQTSGFTDTYYVTQCGYNNREVPEGASIEVKGVELQYADAAVQVCTRTWT